MKNKEQIKKLYYDAEAVCMLARNAKERRNLTLKHPKNNLYDIESFYAGVYNAIGYLFTKESNGGPRNIIFERTNGNDDIHFTIPLPHHKPQCSDENNYRDLDKALNE